MRIVTTSYINSPEYKRPSEWLERIDFHVTVLESLALTHEVISIEQINYEGELKRNGVYYQFLNFRKPKSYFPFKLHQHIKDSKPDVVWVHGLHFPFQIIQLRKVLGRRVPVIVQHHAEKPFKGWRKLLQKKADRVIDQYLFASKEFGQEWIKAGIISYEDKISEVMEASSVFELMDRSEAKEITGANGNPIFLWAGRLDANKDPLTVVRSFISFVMQCPSAKLYMIFQQDQLLKEVQNLISNNSEQIILVCKLPHKELEPWYNSADFIISGSQYEGSGIAVVEAMSCGCIPLLTDIPSFRSMTNGNCGYLFSPGDSEQLTSLLLQTPQINMEEEKAKTLKQYQDALSPTAIAYKIARIILAHKA